MDLLASHEGLFQVVSFGVKIYTQYESFVHCKWLIGIRTSCIYRNTASYISGSSFRARVFGTTISHQVPPNTVTNPPTAVTPRNVQNVLYKTDDLNFFFFFYFTSQNASCGFRVAVCEVKTGLYWTDLI